MAERCAPHVAGRLVALSFQTLGELWHGALMRPPESRWHQDLERFVRRSVVLTCDEATVRTWAELKRQTQMQGLPKDAADLWVAATAKRHSLPLLTNDRGFLSGLGIEIISP